jgi:hypothetical protein
MTLRVRAKSKIDHYSDNLPKRTKQGEGIHTEKQKEATPKDKESSFKIEEYNILYKKLEYKNRLQSSQALPLGEEILILRFSAILPAKSSTSGSTLSTTSRYS